MFDTQLAAVAAARTPSDGVRACARLENAACAARLGHMADLLEVAYAADESDDREQWCFDNWSAVCAQIGAAHAITFGFRPGRRCQDAIEAIRFDAHHGYEWVFEADIPSCFDEIDHTALMGRIRDRISDKHVLALIKAFLRAGVLTGNGLVTDTNSGTPQGGTLSPLLANIALSVLDQYFQDRWNAHNNDTARRRYRHRGGATYRLTRYADDFVVMVFGTREHAVAIQDDVASVLATMGLKLAPEKTRIVSIDEGFDFLGFHLQRHTQRGTSGCSAVSSDRGGHTGWQKRGRGLGVLFATSLVARMGASDVEW